MAGRRAVGRGILVAGMVAAMAACGGGSGDGSTDDVGEDVDEDAGEDAGAIVGSLVVIHPEVTVDGSAVDGSAEVGAGSAIETDAAGFAELGLALGSLLRIDVGTSVEVLELSDDGGATKVRTRVASGRTWSRTGNLGDDDSYVIETPFAVAETTDGAFVTECSDIRCSFTVLKGSVDVELPDGTAVTVDAPASVEARDGTLEEPVIVPFDGAFGDPWLTENNDLDVEAGLDDVVAAYAELDPAFASLAGTFTGSRTVTDVTCDPACSGDEAVVGEVAERSYAFDIDCSKGTPCTGTVDTEYVINDQVVSGVQPLTFDGTTYRWTVEQAIPACQGDGTGEVVVTIEWALAPATAELRDGDVVVTTLDGEITATNVVTAPGTCTGDRRSDSSTSSVSVAR